MSIKVKVNTEQFDRLAKRFDKAAVGDALLKAGLFLQREIAFAPPKAAGAFTALATPRQKRAYWARVRSGQAKQGANGYIRTGNIIRAWTTRKRSTTSVEVGNAAQGAMFLYDQRAQQPFHAASGWPRVDKFVAENERKVARIIDSEIAKMLGN